MLPTTPGVSLATGATGAYNGYFRMLAENLVAAGMASSVLRLGWEFNEGSNPWYAAGQSENFVNYWRQIVETMRAVPGSHFMFEWNPNRGDQGPGDQAMGNFDNYYPGSDYVDIVGLDVYDVGWNSYPGAAQEFSDIETQPWGLDWIASFGAAHGKPLAIPEMGLGWGPSAPGSGPIAGNGAVCGGDNPTFITDMFEWIRGHNVANAVFWDYGTSSIEERQNPLAASALEQVLAQLSAGGGGSSDSTNDRPSTGGYWEVSADGGVFAFNAPFEGSVAGLHLNAPIVGMAADPSTGGYWEVSADGGVFAFNAPFEGSVAGLHLNAPIVGMAADPSTGGYWEVSADGGVFAFNAPFEGSVAGLHLNAPIVGMAADPSTGGYWEVSADGGVFAFNAPFEGSVAGLHLNAPIVGMAADPSTGGYWEVSADGGVFAFNAPFEGSVAGLHLNAPIVGMAADPSTGGYWEVSADGGVFAFNAPFEGSVAGLHLNAPIVGVT